MLIFIFILLAILLSVAGTTCKYGIGPTPTSPKVKNVLEAVLPQVGNGIIYELGAGCGTLAFSLADHYLNHSVIAIEVSFFPWAILRIREWMHPRKNLIIVYGDFFKQNLIDARLVVCYLCPKSMKTLEVKFNIECPQATIISHTFALPNRRANQVFYAPDLYHTPIYIYENDQKK